MNRYLTIKNNIETEIVVKKSKFIANFIKVSSKEQAEEEIKKIPFGSAVYNVLKVLKIYK